MFLETRLTRALIDKYSASGHWKNRVLHDYFLQHAMNTPEKIAVADRKSRYSYRQLVDLSDRIALGFLELGIRPSDVVSVQLPNWNEFPIIALALERIGGVINPISPLMREREVSGMLSVARSRALIVPDAFKGFIHAAMALELRSESPDLDHVIVVGGTVPEGCIRWADFVDTAWERKLDKRCLDFLQPDPNAVVMLAFTSGTTGEPKGVLQTHNTLITMVDSSIRRQKLRSDEIVHMASTVGHGVGYYWGVRMPLQVGGTAVYQDVWDASEAVRLFEAERVTYTSGSTAMFVDLLNLPDLASYDLSSLRLSQCGGANIPPSLAAEVVNRLPGRLCPLWGMTEMGVCTGTDESSPIEKVVSTDGSPQPEVELKIVDGEGRDLPPGQEGVLLARGPFNFVGYIQGREFTNPFFREDEWFDTGDLAHLDRDGYLRITGRMKDIIVRGGENVPVKEIEDILFQHPRILDVAIVAMADNRLGEKACACIVPRHKQHLGLTEVREFLAGQKVARPFWPERVELYSELPRTLSGKIQKFALRADVAQHIREGV